MDIINRFIDHLKAVAPHKHTELDMVKSLPLTCFSDYFTQFYLENDADIDKLYAFFCARFEFDPATADDAWSNKTKRYLTFFAESFCA